MFKFVQHIVYVLDIHLIPALKTISPVVARFSIAIVFVWFGALKVVGVSPATDIVLELQAKTIPFIEGGSFVIILGILEVLIGLLFLLPHWERLSILFLVIHMVATFLPVIFVQQVVWQGFLTPTLEGQYIFKNIVIIAMAIGIAAHLKPIKDA